MSQLPQDTATGEILSYAPRPRRSWRRWVIGLTVLTLAAGAWIGKGQAEQLLWEYRAWQANRQARIDADADYAAGTVVLRGTGSSWSYDWMPFDPQTGLPQSMGGCMEYTPDAMYNERLYALIEAHGLPANSRLDDIAVLNDLPTLVAQCPPRSLDRLPTGPDGERVLPERGELVYISDAGRQVLAGMPANAGVAWGPAGSETLLVQYMGAMAVCSDLSQTAGVFYLATSLVDLRTGDALCHDWKAMPPISSVLWRIG